MNFEQIVNPANWVLPPLKLDGGEVLSAPIFNGDRADCAGIELKRDLELRDNFLRISMTVTNRRNQSVLLRSVPVFGLKNQAVISDAPFTNWRIDRLARNKNDIPGIFNPSVDNLCLREAIFDCSEVPAGGGLSGAELFDDPNSIAGTEFFSDPAMIFSVVGEKNALFMGFSGQERHLNRIRFATTADRQNMEEFTAEAEFDGILLPAGTTRQVQDFIIETGCASRELLHRHVARVKRNLGERQSKFRNIYCTWYYYGLDINEAEVLENVDYIRSLNLPFETFQIDSGWFNTYGDWDINSAKFPNGMAKIAEKIAEAGLRPGIWTAPFVISPESEIIKKYPELALKNADGSPCAFVCDGGKCMVLDPYSAPAPEFLNNLYAKLREWGYTYHKLDFLRAVFINPMTRFANPEHTRGEAYRYIMQLVRDAAGPDATINACGGLYEGSAGLGDIIRNSTDLRGHWDPIESEITGYTKRMKQNLMRNVYNELWTGDPDALQLRRNSDTSDHLRCGVFTDEEAFSIVVNQQLGGGLLTVSEKFKLLDSDRLELLKQSMPFVCAKVEPFDLDTEKYLPEKVALYYTQPRQGDYVVATLLNWNDRQARTIGFAPAEIPNLPPAPKYALFEFKTQKILGVVTANERVELNLPEHAARVVRVTPITGNGKFIVGSKQHICCGAELASPDDPNAVTLNF